ncbi:MAG: leucine-rich repeat protein [Clostridia bacterium]|nr:leucine-rich repeat protein [Clostridia bacterium]
MKRLLSLILAAVMLTSFAGAIPVFAETVAEGSCGESLTWVLDGEGTLTISGTGEMTNYTWSTHPSWYDYRNSIKKVVIGEGVTSVGEEAFWGYSNLSEVQFPSTMKALYYDAFSACSALTEVTIPPSVDVIDFAFSYGMTIKGYEYSAAEVFASLTDATFISLGEVAEKVLSAGDCGDNATYTLTNRGVLTVTGEGAISAYEYEESPWAEYINWIRCVDIAEGITSVGDGAFNGCRNLGEIILPEGLTDVGMMAFYCCNAVTELKLPSTLKTIGDDAFNSSMIAELVIPEGVTSIGAYAFGGAPTTKVTIPESVTYIGEEAFGDGGYTECVILGAKGSYAEEYANENGYVFKGSVSAVSGTIGDSITWLLNEEGTLTISGTGPVDDWGSDRKSPWYEYRENIVEVIVEDGITSLGGYSFWYNTVLEKVTIPESVEYVDFYFIWNESNNITIKGATYSEAYNYANNRGYNFVSTGFAERREVASGTCGENVTYVLDNYGTLTISGNSGITNYSDWYDYRTDIKDIVIESGVTSICSDAFTMCDELKSVTIPISVGYIDTWSMPTGTGLVIKGYEPSSAKTFAENRGYNFESLGTAPVTTVASGRCGEKATWSFDNYGLLKIEGTGEMDFDITTGGDVVIGGEVAGGAVLMASAYDVPWYSYKGEIREVDIAEGITTIADYAFSECENLKEVNLPSSIVSLGYQAFAWNSALNKVTIHYNTMTFGEYAFYSTPNAVIYGYAGSAAERFANENGKEFVSIGEAPLVTVADGTVTDTINWTLDSRGKLTITGTGSMPDYDYSSERPWDKYKTSVKSLEINGVDYVGEYSFVSLPNLATVVLNGVKAVANYAFYNCYDMTEVTLPASLTDVKRNSFENGTSLTIKALEGTYAQMYAEYRGHTFEALEGEIEIKTVYVSSIEELIAAIASNTEIIIEDGVYLLDRSSYMGDLQYSWEYADTIRIKDVINLTIKARNPGKVEILALQNDVLGYSHQYENAPFYIEGAYNLVIEGIRFGNMDMRSNNGSRPAEDDAVLMGGVDENALVGYNGAYIQNGEAADYYSFPLASKVTFRDCDIFNGTYAITFYGTSLTVDNCVLRDNVKGAIISNTDDVVLNNSVLSRNGNSEAYRGTYCLDTSANVTNCTFINNGNEAYASGTITGEGTVFSNNNWDGETPKAYGVTKNGITWSVDKTNTLKLGYTVNADSLTIESKTGTVYPYTAESLPWKAFDIAKVNTAEGVTYNYIPNGPCGETARWSYDEKTKTLTISGKGNMSNMGYIEAWYAVEIENIVIADTITGVYNLFNGTKYSMNEANWENGMLYIGDVLVRVKEEVEGKVTVKSGTRVIAEEAFGSCRNITEIVIPEGVISLGVTEKLNVGEYTQNGVFAYCKALEKLTIPATVTDFDHALVYGCDNLRDIYYKGTMAQWEKITVGKHNDQLEYCTVHTADGTITPDILYYTVEEDGVHITGVYPFAEEVVVPYEIDGVKVVEIYDEVFVGHQSVKSVTIEADIERAPYFANCKSLEKVVLGDSIKYVLNDTFAGCEKLKSISLGDFIEEMSLRDLEGSALYNNEANWEDGILYVDGYAAVLSPEAEGKITVRSDALCVCYDTFNNNDKVTEIFIPDGVRVQSFGETFYNMTALETVTLPNTYAMPEYGSGVFECEKLENMHISESHPSLVSVDGVVYTKDMTTLVYMPMGRRSECEIPEGVTTIGSGAFAETHLSALTIPGSVNYISDGAFSYSNYLTDIYYNIPVAVWEDWEQIYVGYGNNAFNDASLHLLDYEFIAEDMDYRLSPDGTYYIVSGCKDYVHEAVIPATYDTLPVKEVDSSAFMNKAKLTAINVDSANKYLTSVDGVLYTKDMATLLAYPAGRSDESFTLPEGVKTIGEYAFAYSKNLTSVDLGDELINICSWAFEGSGIKSVAIPETVTVLVRGAFWTPSLETVSFGTHITSIEQNAFANELKSIYFNGSMGDWYMIDGHYNVGYETKIITKIVIHGGDAFETSEEEIMVEIGIEDLEPSQSIIMIGIDGDGAHVTYDECYGEELYAGPLTIDGDKDEIEKVETVKIFVWESLESMRPLSDPIEIPVTR